jgi:transposase
MRAYSPDLRQRVLADCDRGLTTRAVATKYDVSESWVRRLKQRRQATGETAARAQRHGRVPLAQTHGDPIRQAVRDQPDATLAELRQQFNLTVALSTLWAAVTALGLRLKKSRARRGAGPARREGAAGQLAGVAAVDGPLEAGVRGRDRGDDRDGPSLWPRPKRRAAGRAAPPRTLEGDHAGGGAAPRWSGSADDLRRGDQRRPVRGVHRASAGTRVAARRRGGDGQLSSHKRVGVRAALEKAGCQLWYLPPYSPDLKPIENAFSKLKALLRKTRERTVAGLQRFLCFCADAFQSEECANYFAHCGYHATPIPKPL